VFVAAALWGLHLGLTQGVFAAVVADMAPAELRGTGFGFFYMATGIALFIGSIAAGELWDHIGPAVPFAVGAVLAAVSVTAYIWLRRVQARAS
jgi:MFS family permease